MATLQAAAETAQARKADPEAKAGPEAACEEADRDADPARAGGIPLRGALDLAARPRPALGVSRLHRPEVLKELSAAYDPRLLVGFSSVDVPRWAVCAHAALKNRVAAPRKSEVIGGLDGDHDRPLAPLVAGAGIHTRRPHSLARSEVAGLRGEDGFWRSIGVRADLPRSGRSGSREAIVGRGEPQPEATKAPARRFLQADVGRCVPFDRSCHTSYVHPDRRQNELTAEEEELARSRWALVIGLAVVLIAAIVIVGALLVEFSNIVSGPWAVAGVVAGANGKRPL
jgi:hypothetical protein